jgi:hypothetical protein
VFEVRSISDPTEDGAIIGNMESEAIWAYESLFDCICTIWLPKAEKVGFATEEYLMQSNCFTFHIPNYCNFFIHKTDEIHA